ncbi:MAG: YhbY family RNA-binding protein [Burkholderiales bacterium]|jgi:RNA-binding protein|nr:YhbY family RNA-binding protein [Burkholderiales bacterium]
MLTLAPIERRALRAQAHALSPVVMIGQHGLTPAVLREIDHALNTHELIKVRIFNNDRTERETLQLAICDRLTCAPVQHLGKLIVLWRPAPPKAEAAPKPAKRPAKKTASKKAAKKAAAAKLPGAISRHGQAIKPLSARQAREQAQQPAWQPHETWQPRNAGRKSFSSDAPDDFPGNRRRSPRPAGRSSQGGSAGVPPASRRSPQPAGRGAHAGGSHTGGKSPFPKTKPSAKQPARQPHGISAAPKPANRRRLGVRAKT